MKNEDWEGNTSLVSVRVWMMKQSVLKEKMRKIFVTSIMEDWFGTVYRRRSQDSNRRRRETKRNQKVEIIGSQDVKWKKKNDKEETNRVINERAAD